LEILPPEEQEQSLQTTPSNNPVFTDAADPNASFSPPFSSSSSSSLVLHQSPTVSLQLAGARTLEIPVDAEDDDFSREARINAALEAAAEIETATLEAMELQTSMSSSTALALVVGPSPLLAEKRPRSPSSSPSREDSQCREKIPARAGSQSLEASMLRITEEGAEAEERSPSVPSSHHPTAEAAALQLRRLLEEFRSSLTPRYSLARWPHRRIRSYPAFMRSPR
jgi:hypothetical protein